MKIENKSQKEIIDLVALEFPEIYELLEKHTKVIYENYRFKGSVKPYQAAVIYYLHRKHYHWISKNCKILEIGTGIGFSTSFIAAACPNAKIVTLNPNQTEQNYARQQLDKLGFQNIEYSDKLSWNYYGLGNKFFDVVFVDGDHAKIRRDYQWWDNINDGGMFLFHDYTPAFSTRPQTFVFDELNKFCVEICREDFDIMVMDNQDFLGMAGFYK